MLLSFGGAARFFDNHLAISRIGNYIWELESRLRPMAGGWQHFHEPRSKRNIAWTIRRSSWVVLMVITVLVPALRLLFRP